MRRTLAYLAAWLAAGVAAVSLASVGVSMVGRQVTADRPSPLSADDVRSELESGQEQVRPDTAPPSSIGAPSTTTTPASGGSDDPVGGTTGSGSSGPRVTSAPTTDDRVGAVTTTTARPDASPETRSYTLVGGSVTLRFTSAGVTIVAASPNAGFSVETESTHDTGVRVRFRSDAHESQVEGWWDAGPRDEVRETG